MRAATSAMPRGQRDQHGVEDHPELRDAEVELALEGREADEQAAHQADAAQRRPANCESPQALGRDAAEAQALGEQDRLADERQAGAAEEHQVRRAPERDVLAEEAVPHVVEREAEQREAAAGRDQHAADRDVPVARDADRGGAGLLLGQRQREAAGGEDAVEADEDQVVRGVGQRAGVAPLVDVQGDVPVHAEQGDEQGAAADAERQRRPGGQAGRRASENVARRRRGRPCRALAVAEDADSRTAGGDAGHAGRDRDLVDARRRRRVRGAGERRA